METPQVQTCSKTPNMTRDTIGDDPQMSIELRPRDDRMAGGGGGMHGDGVDHLDGLSHLDHLDGEMDGLGAMRRRRNGLDERTEIILAATFLVLIILAFIRYV